MSCVVLNDKCLAFYSSCLFFFIFSTFGRYSDVLGFERWKHHVLMCDLTLFFMFYTLVVFHQLVSYTFIHLQSQFYPAPDWGGSGDYARNTETVIHSGWDGDPSQGIMHINSHTPCNRQEMLASRCAGRSFTKSKTESRVRFRKMSREILE